MINRNPTQSQYVFNSETGMLEKLLEITGIPQAVNEQKQNETKVVTNITVITAEDNLVHNYFYSYETSWDATNCLQIATIRMPKMGQENINYWATYTGQLTVYMGCDFTYDKVNKTTHSTEQEAAESLTRFYNNSHIKPYFRGEIDRIKEYNNDILIYVKNIGGRFQQKIPEDFRQSYIYNQNVRDAFQAICEFLGVQYICPPRTITDENGEETTDENDTDGTENSTGKQIANAQALANKAKSAVKKNKKKKTDSTKSASKSLPNSNNTEDTEENEEESEEDAQLEESVDDIINGYGDVNFDANGSIVHGSKVIETSPDMADTLTTMEEHPFEKYLEDETGIIEKVNGFLRGEMFDEIHSNVMDYNAITIEPKSTSSSDMSTVSGAPGDTTGGDTENSNSSSSSSGTSSTFGNKSSRSREKNGWINGQYYINGKIYLSKSYINSLSPKQAAAKRASGLRTYTSDTLQKLLWRSMGTTLR